MTSMVNIKQIYEIKQYNLQSECERECTKFLGLYKYKSIKEDTKEENNQEEDYLIMVST